MIPIVKVDPELVSDVEIALWMPFCGMQISLFLNKWGLIGNVKAFNYLVLLISNPTN